MRDEYCSPLVSGGMARLRDKAYRENIPLSATYALNYQCNLHCNVCYLADASRSVAPLPAVFWQKVADESATLGCLHVLLTGGECVMHPEFSEIYLGIRRRGMLTTVFSNGTLFGDDGFTARSKIMEVFAEAPPSAVEVSVYGAGNATWEKVTGSPNGWDMCRRGVERLLDAGIKVRVKMLLTDQTRHDLPLVKQWADRLGINFRFDPALFPAFDKSTAAVDHRVPAKDAVDVEFADEELCREWTEFHNHFSKIPDEGLLYDCGAGRTAFHIEPDGTMQPCLMVRSPSVDLQKISVTDGWHSISSEISRMRLPENSPCRGCEAKVLCGYCPGFFEIETGSSYEPPEYFCALGKERLRRVGG